MKKEKNKDFEKKLRKGLRNDLEARLIENLKSLVNTMDISNKKVEKLIEKNAEEIAKKIAKVADNKQTSIPVVANQESLVNTENSNSDTSKDENLAPEFSSPQPISLSETNTKNGDKKPVIPSEKVDEPSALEIAENITNH